MKNQKIVSILNRISKILKTPESGLAIRRLVERMDPQESTFEGFLASLSEVAVATNLSFIRKEFTAEEFKELIKNLSFPSLLFIDHEGLKPMLIFGDERNVKAWIFYEDNEIELKDDEISIYLPKILSYDEIRSHYNSGNLKCSTHPEKLLYTMNPVQMQSMVGQDLVDDLHGKKEFFSPLKRLFKFISSERKNILYIYVYAIIIGLINLSLPLGIQAIIGRISGGMLFDGIIVLITFVVIGIIISGGLQIMQIYLVEILQRRIFTKAAFEFAFRIPRIRTEALLNAYPPELMNRFFDVLTLQKGFSKILLDLTTAFLQILFGLLLLSFYHSSFIFFGILLFAVLILMFRITGPKALKTSIKESSYKYQTVAWFEEMARNIQTFKLAGYTNMPLDKTDDHVDEYLGARKKHFRILISQFINITVFKLLVTAGTLILGCVLVVNREITLGQFVASEIVIIMVINAVEKLILSIETVYDVLTAVEKIGQVSDLPLERSQGIKLENIAAGSGLDVHISNLNYSYPDVEGQVLKNINLDIKAGEKICITGLNGSGKHTLTKILSGLLTNYSGVITINGISLRNLHLTDLHEFVSVNLSSDEVFAGTVEENVRLGKPGLSQFDVIEALKKAGINDFVNQLPNGIFTPLLPGGRGWPGSAVKKLLLARSLVKKPALMLFHDHFESLGRKDKDALIQSMIHQQSQMTLIAISSDPLIMETCDRVVVLSDGSVAASGSLQELSNSPFFKELILPVR
jgi:ABC-type bacteriocin/lantibiotic exporter with double-glycine peptidase domain